MTYNFAVIVPLANESKELPSFINALQETLDFLKSGTVYLVIDEVSIDNTLKLCEELSREDSRFKTIWSPENKNIVDAYLRGYREAFVHGHDMILEMDAGLSHDPRAIPMFLRVLSEGNECAFGSRFINGGSMYDSSVSRFLLSKMGTVLSNLLLGTRMKDMTSGFLGFHRSVIEKILSYHFLSTAHFYQTELRYILRKSRYFEVPIHYRAPSPSVSKKAIKNSIKVLIVLFMKRIIKRDISI